MMKNVSPGTMITTKTSSMIFMIILLLLLCCAVVIVYEGSLSPKKQINRQSLRKDMNLSKQVHLVLVKELSEVHDTANTTEEDKPEDFLQLYENMVKYRVLSEQNRQLESEGKEETEEQDMKKEDKNEENEGRHDELQNATPINTQFDTNDNDQYQYIPIQFRNDREYYRLCEPFPRWQFFSSEEQIDDTDGPDDAKNVYVPLQKSTSIMDSLIKHIDEYSRYLSLYDYSVKYTNWTQYVINKQILFYSDNPIRTTDHSEDWTPGNHAPEILYVVDGEKGIVMTSQYEQDIGDVLGEMAEPKSNRLHKLMSTALNLLLKEKTVPIRWPRLHQLLVEDKGSFPFLAHYSDYIGCNYHNWKNHTESIPLFTVAANLRCNHTFPFPSHILYKSAKTNSEEWNEKMIEWKDKYPLWSDKISKSVWRGKLNGNMTYDGTERGIRWNLANIANDANKLTPEQLNIFDVKMTDTNLWNREWFKSEEIGRNGENFRIDQEDFQKYKAIIDVDGFSWSSRFSFLLCYNSVILKIEPEYVDYYYNPIYKNGTSNSNDNIDPYTIMPWKHYIPIKGDLSDIIEKASYAVDPANEEHILNIIKNANEWCKNKYTIPSLNLDLLDIWENYVITLDKSTELKNLYLSSQSDQSQRLLLGHKNWEDQWNEIKDKVYNGTLEMLPVWYIP